MLDEPVGEHEQVLELGVLAVPGRLVYRDVPEGVSHDGAERRHLARHLAQHAVGLHYVPTICRVICRQLPDRVAEQTIDGGEAGRCKIVNLQLTCGRGHGFGSGGRALTIWVPRA